LLTIPTRALVSGLKEPSVFVVEGDHVTVRKVVTGRQEGESVEVVSGVKEGEKVVVAGQINLSEGSLVEITQQ
jgi:multidrug efflux pump subunit AcrA (membrane-fusion protein)